MAIDSTTPAQGDTQYNLLWKLLKGFANGTFVGSGGGGGGAVTIADGADVAEGAKGDAAATDNTSSWSVVSLLKGLYGRTLATLSVQTADGAVVTLGAKADVPAVLPTESNTAMAFLKAIYATIVAGPINVSVQNASLAVTGNTGGYTNGIKVALTTSTSIYVAGYTVGGKQTLANAVRSPKTGVLESLIITDASNQSAAMDIFIFDDDPAAATTTDHAAFAFSTDLTKAIARISVGATDYVTVNAAATAVKSGLGIAVKSANTTSLYAVAVTSGTPTYSASALQFVWGFLQD